MTVWPDKAPNLNNWRYGKEHHNECLCEACLYGFHNHNFNKHCSCKDCGDTRYAQQRMKELRYEAEMMQDEIETGRGKMSAINVCDRCSTMMTGNALASIRYNVNNTDRPETLEICPGCVIDFLEWTKSLPTNERPKVYKEPFRVVTDADVTKMDYEEVVKLARKAIGMMINDTPESPV